MKFINCSLTFPSLIVFCAKKLDCEKEHHSKSGHPASEWVRKRYIPLSQRERERYGQLQSSFDPLQL